MDSRVVYPAILSGLFAASAAVFGKLATTRSIAQHWWSLTGVADHFSSTTSQYVLWSLQAFWFVMMFVSNAVMWSQFSLALARCRITLHVTIINTMTNFVFTAAFGSLLFGEQITLQWMLGIALLVAGFTLLKSDQSSQEDKKSD